MTKIKSHLLLHTYTHSLVILTLLSSLFISWRIVDRFDYFYPFFYEQINISQHIQKYAPQNRKGHKHFETTSKAERISLFSGIVSAINNNGEGLKQLEYSIPHRPPQRLLTKAEIIHLEDVSNLFNTVVKLGIVTLVLWILMLPANRYLLHTRPTLKQIVIASLLQISFVTIFVAIAGPRTVFFHLHKMIFPSDHQWFFYYPESLMATFMKAPFLFGYIALAIVLFALPVATVLTVILLSSNRIRR